MTTVSLRILKQDQTTVCGNDLETLLEALENSSRFSLGIDNTKQEKVYVKPDVHSTQINSGSYAAKISVDYEAGLLEFRPLEKQKKVVLGMYLHNPSLKDKVSSHQENTTQPGERQEVRERLLYHLFFSFLKSVDHSVSEELDLSTSNLQRFLYLRVDIGKNTLYTDNYRFVYEITDVLTHRLRS